MATPKQLLKAKKIAEEGPTFPGDTIEVSITAEVKNRRGLSLWIKAGLSSTHRDDETTEEAYGRVSGFVIDRVQDLTDEYLQ